MDQVLPKVWVTRSLEPGAVPDGVDHVFVFGERAPAVTPGSLGDGVAVTRADDADIEEYETFARLADDVVYATKGGQTVLLVRRDDGVLMLAALGKIRSDSPRQVVEFLETTHGLESRPYGPTLPGHFRQYVYE
jgi:hypothetical protein